MPYMNYKLCELPKGRKTQMWEVSSIMGGCILGYIQWRSGWRKYVFQPAEDTVFDASCLREMADFLEQETRIQKERIA